MTNLNLASATEAGAVGDAADAVVGWFLSNGEPFFNGLNGLILSLAELIEQLLSIPSPWLLALGVALLALWRVGAVFSLLSLLGLNLVVAMQLWEPMVTTLSLVLAASLLEASPE